MLFSFHFPGFTRRIIRHAPVLPVPFSCPQELLFLIRLMGQLIPAARPGRSWSVSSYHTLSFSVNEIHGPISSFLKRRFSESARKQAA